MLKCLSAAQLNEHLKSTHCDVQLKSATSVGKGGSGHYTTSICGILEEMLKLFPLGTQKVHCDLFRLSLSTGLFVFSAGSLPSFDVCQPFLEVV